MATMNSPHTLPFRITTPWSVSTARYSPRQSCWREARFSLSFHETCHVDMVLAVWLVPALRGLLTESNAL
jgi:hypothetical protein